MHGFGNILVLEEQLQDKINMDCKAQYARYLEKLEEEKKRKQEEMKYEFLRRKCGSGGC